MSSTYPQELFVKNLHAAIQNAVQDIAREETDKAITVMEQRVKQEVGAIAIRVAQWADMQFLQDRLVITVKMDEFKKVQP